MLGTNTKECDVNDDNPFDDLTDDVEAASHEEVLTTLRGLETANVVNRDNELLHPWGAFGNVDEVNGRGAKEIPNFVATRHELFQLAKYWAVTLYEMNFRSFLFSTSGSREIRLGPFAERRIDRIADCIGEALVAQACQEAEEEFARSADPEGWQVFRRGTPEERVAFQNKVQREIGGIGEEDDGSGSLTKERRSE